MYLDRMYLDTSIQRTGQKKSIQRTGTALSVTLQHVPIGFHTELSPRDYT
jgi:hypothetical protein